MIAWIPVDTSHGTAYYTGTYLVSVILAAGIAFYSGCKKDYPGIPWLLVLITGCLFFFLGEKIAAWSPWQWRHLFQDFELPSSEKKTILGGITGLFAGLLLAKAWLRFNRPVLDRFAVALPVCMAVARVGCLVAGCCYGTPTSLPWGIQYDFRSLAYQSHMAYGLIGNSDACSAPVHPVQVYDLLGCLLIALVAWKSGPWWKGSGSRFFFTVLCYALLRFLLEFLRAPARDFPLVSDFHGLKLVQWVLLAVIITGTVALVSMERRARLTAKRERQASVSILRQATLMALLIMVLLAGRELLNRKEILLILLLLVPAITVFILAQHRKYVISKGPSPPTPGRLLFINNFLLHREPRRRHRRATG